MEITVSPVGKVDAIDNYNQVSENERRYDGYNMSTEESPRKLSFADVNNNKSKIYFPNSLCLSRLWDFNIYIYIYLKGDYL